MSCVSSHLLRSLPQAIARLAVVGAGFGAIAPGFIAAAQAEPASIFRPYLNEIIRSAPPGYPIRLPSQVLLGAPAHFSSDELTVKVFASQIPMSLTVGLFACEPGTATHPCLVGTVTTERSNDGPAQTELSRHRLVGDRITFRPGLAGYLVDGSQQTPKAAFSSVMWQQGNVIYTVSFPAGQRQNLLDMSASMALSDPLRVSLPRSIPASVPPSQGAAQP